jgi:hypothetical protein
VFKKQSQKALPPANPKEVFPDGFRDNRRDSKKHGADTFRPFSKELGEKAEAFWKRAIEGGAEALEGHLELMRRVRVIREAVESGEVMADQIALLELELRVILVEDKVTGSVLTSSERGKRIGWLTGEQERAFDAIRFNVVEVADAGGNAGTPTRTDA